MVPDSAFTDGDVSEYASIFGWSTTDARDELAIDSSNSPTDTSADAKRHRNKAKGIIILQTQINALRT